MPDQDEYTGRLARPGESCQTEPHEDWTEPEQWAWKQICEGRPADFHARYGEIDSKKEDDWTPVEKERRHLSSLFLVDILLHEPWRSLVPRQGVCIVGAWFVDDLDLSNSLIVFDLILASCRFEKGIDLHDCHLTMCLSWATSTVNGPLSMYRLRVDTNLYMIQGVFKDETSLRGADVSGHLDMNSATFCGELSMDRLKVGNSLFMTGGTFERETRLLGTEVAAQLNMKNATVNGELSMDNMKVGNNLYMTEGKFEETRLPGVYVGGQLDLSGATIKGKIDMDSLRVRELFLVPQLCKKEVILAFAAIQNALILNGDSLKTELNLTGTKVDRVFDHGGAWPTKLHLDDFTYKHLGSTKKEYGSPHMTERPASWFKDWLARQKTYSPQPYEHCAKVLREAGRPDTAHAVLHAAKTRERKLSSPLRWVIQKSKICSLRTYSRSRKPVRWIWKQIFVLKRKQVKLRFLRLLRDWIVRAPKDPARPRWRWLWLTILRFTVGYGLGWRYFFYPLAWAAGLTFYGAWIASGIHTWPDEYTFWNCILNSNDLFKPCVLETHNFGWRLLFSLDRLLPLVELSKDHNTIYFAGWYRFYFNFIQPMAGWILALLVIAGLRPAQKL